MLYLLTYCPWCPLACRAATTDLHSCLSRALLPIESHVSPIALSFSIRVLRQVIFGLPRFLFPSGVQYSAILALSSLSLLRTCPIHLHLRFISMFSMLSCSHLLSSSSFEILFGQNILNIRRKLFVWKTDTLSRSSLVIRQHSDAYRRVEKTQLWYSFSLVLILYCCDFQMLLSMLKAYLALLIRFLMSLSAPPTFVTILASM